MSDENGKQRPDVIFFFGAGASVDAGIPHTYKFVEDFESYIKKRDSSLHEQLRIILEVRRGFNERTSEKRQVDIEQLLDTLTRLIHKEEEVLLDFYEKKVFAANITENSLRRLKRQLEDFIREKVIVKDDRQLEYLKELLKFERLEIYSVNYDTCIEQLSHISHRRYADGFDTYWDRKIFFEDYDIKHFKMHGSVIWYENKRTKECVKIPVHVLNEKEPVKLKLIYGEIVEPLLIYPAQKMEYVEPLTELQLMFKNRLTEKETKILVVVGYSFRDDYIIRMLWDAGRINDGLRIILIDPLAHKHFENKLRFIDKNDKNLSRICDKVVCLPYPFSGVISRLKNHYLPNVRRVSDREKECIELEKTDRSPNWPGLLTLCIDCEFLTKAEGILEKKIRKKWSEIDFQMHTTHVIYAVKGLLHSVVAENGLEDKWLDRLNESLDFLSIENLGFDRLDMNGFQLAFRVDRYSNPVFATVIDDWIDRILTEREHMLVLLTSKYEKNLSRIGKSFERLKAFRDYLDRMKSSIKWKDYLSLELRQKRDEIARITQLLDQPLLDQQPDKENLFKKLEALVLEVERWVLKKVFDEKKTLHFEFQD